MNRNIPDKPLLFIGYDLGVKRDTAGIAAVYKIPGERARYALWGHRCYDPKVVGDIKIAEITDLLIKIIETQNVGGIYYDRWQLYSEMQRLSDMGYGDILVEVNQQQGSVEFSNNLSSMIDSGDFVLYPDQTVRSHFSWCGARSTERGFRIEKIKQNRPIDMVVAIAMALYGAQMDRTHALHPSAHSSDSLSFEDLP